MYTFMFICICICNPVYHPSTRCKYHTCLYFEETDSMQAGMATAGMVGRPGIGYDTMHLWRNRHKKSWHLSMSKREQLSTSMFPTRTTA